MPVLGLGIPERRPFRQPQFRTSTAGFPLLAGQPVPQGMDQIVVGQLVVASPGEAVGRSSPEPSGSVGVIRRSSSIEDVDQIGKLTGALV